VDPGGSFELAAKDIPRIALFAVTALFVISLSAAQRRTADSLRRARDDLQAAVDELARLNKALQVENIQRKRSEAYLDEIRQIASRDFKPGEITLKFQFIPDREMEIYLKGGDVLVLPYKDIFQSGVLFLAYTFGLPVVATDVGSFREEIVEGKTGFICKPGDPADLAKSLETYFLSDIYANLHTRRQDIKDYANTVHSWDAVAELTHNAYVEISGRQSQ